MIIRHAREDDLNDLLRIARNATQHMEKNGIFQWDDSYPNRNILETDIQREHTRVIENEGNIAGFITVDEEESPEYKNIAWSFLGRVLVIHRLTIDPAHQGKKFASRLMDYAEEEAKSNGYDTVRLDAFTKNPIAVSLYEKRGYRNAGTVQFRKGQFYCFEKLINDEIR